MKKNIIILSLVMLVPNCFLNAQLVSYETNAIKLNIPESQDKLIALPTINWIYPAREYSNSEERMVELDAMVESSTPIESIKVSLYKERGGEVIGAKRIEVPENALRHEFKQSFNLLKGENIIGIETTNTSGGTVVAYRNILHGLDAISKAVDINRKDYALLIGTDKYDNWSDLVNPVYDVQTIAEELKENYGFETEVLTDPSQDEILIKLKEYASRKYKPQDQLLIFFAGHGQFDETFGEGYLVTKGSLVDDEAKTSYIPHSVLRNVVNNIPSKHILLMMDVCFSGTFDPVIARSRATAYENVDTREFLVRKLSKVTRKYLTSGGKEYVSDGIPGQHSPFAKRFLEVLKTRGGGDQIITLTDIYSSMEKLQTLPRMGEFGENEKDSDFVFVVK